MHRFHLAVLALSVSGCNTALAANGKNIRLRDGSTAPSSLDDVFAIALNDGPIPLDRSRRVLLIPSANVNDENDDPQTEYIQDCESYLFEQTVLHDGIISQQDFVAMLLHQCRQQLDTTCPYRGNNKLKFEQLDLTLQLKFIKGICHHEELADRFDCIQDLNDMWMSGNKFGFQVDSQELDSLVRDMCIETYVDAAGMGFVRTSSAPEVIINTSSPTDLQLQSSTPTKLPSREPSHAPSSKPSSGSSNPPTTYILSLPPTTYIPTFSPTKLPSLSPSFRPTSSGRVVSPTYYPSVAPPVSPSILGTPSSSEPVEDGIVGPTLYPTSVSDPSRSTTPTLKEAVAAPKPTAESFASECSSYLISPEFLADDIISQDDFARFLNHHCIEHGKCDDSTTISFNELDVPLQLEFIFGVCSHDTQAGKAQCIDDLKSMWRGGSQFGFDTKVDHLDLLVNEMCYATYGYVLDMGLAESSAPTVQITAPPSLVPTSQSPSVKLQPLTPSPSQEHHSQFPSENPSISSLPSASDENIEASPDDPSREDSLPRRVIIGMSSALALAFTAACIIVYAYHQPRNLSDKHPPKETHQFGKASGEPWGNVALGSLPLSYGLNCSLSSTSSSFRDYRFVSVFGPGGTPIPQFNPNTAGAVVIGSVTIGASSSYSSGPFDNGSRSYTSSKSRSFFTPRRHKSPKSDSSSKDDMSSLSSHRSSHQKSPRYRSFNHRHPKAPRLDQHHHRIESSRVIKSSQRSVGTKASHNTVPLSRKKQQQYERRVGNSQVSFADWRAVSYMTDNFCHQGQATDTAAALMQSSFFFDVLNRPESSVSSPKSLSCLSLPLPNVRSASSSDAGASSILSESYFHEDSMLRAGPNSTSSTSRDPSSADNENESFIQLVPWRKEGWTSSVKLSDMQSNESGSAQSSPALASKSRRGFKPVKALVAKCRNKTRVKDWFSFKHRQYQHLNFALEDPSVVSMKSYSSHANLLPTQMAAPRAEFTPSIVLGTFAAATVSVDNVSPNKPKQSQQLDDTKQMEQIAESISESLLPKDAVIEVEAETSAIDELGEHRHSPSTAGEVETVKIEPNTAGQSTEVGTNSEGSVRIPSTFAPDDTLESKDASVESAGTVQTETSPKGTRHISSLDTTCVEKNDESFHAYSRSDFDDSSAQSRVGDWSDTSCDSSSTDSSRSGGDKVLDCSFAAATAPLTSSVEAEGSDGDVPSLGDEAGNSDSHAAIEDEPHAIHLLGISNFLSDNESSEESIPSAASFVRKGHESSLSNSSDELAQTTIVSNSDPDETQFPSDEEDVLEECAASVIQDQDNYHLELRDGTSVLPVSKANKDEGVPTTAPVGKATVYTMGKSLDDSAIISNDGSSVNTQLNDIWDKPFCGDSGGKVNGLDVLSISLSWDSDGSNSIGTIDLDASFASTVATVPITNTTKCVV